MLKNNYRYNKMFKINKFKIVIFLNIINKRFKFKKC